MVQFTLLRPLIETQTLETLYQDTGNIATLVLFEAYNNGSNIILLTKDNLELLDEIYLDETTKSLFRSWAINNYMVIFNKTPVNNMVVVPYNVNEGLALSLFIGHRSYFRQYRDGRA